MVVYHNNIRFKLLPNNSKTSSKIILLLVLRLVIKQVILILVWRFGHAQEVR